MMRLRTLLPLAAILFTGSCRDSADPVALAPVSVAPSNSVFTPITDVIGANSAGTSVRQGNGPFVIRTPFGDADESTTSFSFSNIDESGTIFGWSSLTSIYYRKIGGEKVEVSLPIVGEQRLSPNPGVGRTLAGGAVVMEVMVIEPGVDPANEGVKLYRWHSTGGWQLVATSLSVATPAAYQPRPLGITDDGSVAWARVDPAGPKTRLYRTAPNGDVTQYEVPAGHEDGAQNAGNNGGAPGWNALGADGSLVGYSFASGITYPIRWAPDGSSEILPQPGGSTNYNARAVNGDYIAGALFDTDHFIPVRWHWNGSGWDFNVFAGDRGVSLDRVHVSTTGLLVATWANASPPGYTFGRVSDLVAFRPSNTAQDNQFIFADDGNRIWTADGYFRPSPELTAPATLTAAVGLYANLPLRILHVLPDKYPMTWQVRWQHGVNKQTQEGTVYADGAVPLVRHIYTQPGTWTARAIITDVDGDADTTFTTVTALGASAAPSAEIDGPTEFEEGQDVVLSAATSSDPNALALTYKWKFDGVAAPEGVTLRRKGVVRGNYPYRLIVENSARLADTVTGTVVVDNIAPTGRFVWPKAPIYEGAEYQLAVENSTDAPTDRAGIEWQFACGGSYGDWGSVNFVTCPGLEQGSVPVAVKLRDGLGAVREILGNVVTKNRAPRVTIIESEARSGTELRIKYQFDDYASDGPWIVTFQVNGVRKRGSQSVTDRNSVLDGLWLPATAGDVVTVRITDKDGAIGSASITIPF